MLTASRSQAKCHYSPKQHRLLGREDTHPKLPLSQVESVQRAAGPADSETTGKRQLQLQPKL